jgi:hypothetical protein
MRAAEEDCYSCPERFSSGFRKEWEWKMFW